MSNKNTQESEIELAHKKAIYDEFYAFVRDRMANTPVGENPF